MIRYGRTGQVCFPDMHAFYYAMGVLAKPGYIELHWENNEDQGAWGSEGRIHCLKPVSYYPEYFRFTAGRGSVYARINCNDYVRILVVEHKFQKDTKYQDIQAIMKTIPAAFVDDFRRGNA